MELSTNTRTRRRLDPVKTREMILNSAFEAFARSGYDGASIGEIAKSAAVNKSLVQYHFGSKEDLWSACLADRVAPMLGIIDQFIADESSDPACLIEARFNFLKEHPEIRRLLSWAGMGSFPTPRFILDRREQILHKIGKSANDPILARFLATLAATDGWFMFRGFYGSLFGEFVFDDGLEQRILEVLLESVSSR